MMKPKTNTHGATAFPKLALAALAAFGISSASAQELPTGLQVTGEARAEVENDTACFLITLSGKGETPQEAKETLLPQNKALMDMLKETEGTDKIQTLGLSSEPLYRQVPNRPPAVIGYQMRAITGVECPAENAGDLTAKIMGLNPESLAGPNFKISEETRKANEVILLEKATDNAVEKAEAIAARLESELGDAIFVSTQSVRAQNQNQPRGMMMAMDSAGTDGGEPMPTEAGRDTLHAAVEVRFELPPKIHGPWEKGAETGRSGGGPQIIEPQASAETGKGVYCDGSEHGSPKK